MLDKRLKAAADYVRRGSCCIDVGTDHGYLAVYLYKNKITDKITACDINEKPLEAARKTFEENGLSDKIKLVLSDGLININCNEAEDILICGMGGELIMKIIMESGCGKDLNKRFILQPMTNIPYLRNELYKNGYLILSETPIVDKNHIYTVMQVCYSGEMTEISPLFSYVGKIPENKTQASKAYLLHQYKRCKKVADGLIKSLDKKEQANQQYELAAQIKDILLQIQIK